MQRRWKKPRAAVLAALLALGGAWALADALDHDEARRAVERGELRPLSEILEAVAREFGGQVIEVDLERKDSGALVYELEVLGRDGRVIELEYDGRTGQLIESDEEDNRRR